MLPKQQINSQKWLRRCFSAENFPTSFRRKENCVVHFHEVVGFNQMCQSHEVGDKNCSWSPKLSPIEEQDEDSDVANLLGPCTHLPAFPL